MLQLKNLTKNFGETAAVSGVSLSVKPGEIFSLIGPNGSGKTTIIKIIAGLLQPTEGSCSVESFDIVKDPVKAKSETGYIPDEPSVWPGMTGEEFLHFTGALYGMEKETRGKRISKLLPTFHFEGIEKGYFENYSRGNKQKFTILAALLHNPKVLLIDEPIVGLDPVSAKTAKQKFKEFAENGGAVLMATHTLSAAEEISTQIGVLTAGKLVTSGTFEELLSQAKLKSGSSLGDVYTALTT